MNRTGPGGMAIAALVALACGCSSEQINWPPRDRSAAVRHALEEVEHRYAPDRRMGIFNVGFTNGIQGLVLTGEVDSAESTLEAVKAVAATGAAVRDHITVLPAAGLGDRTWGIACLSVASGRVQPDHKAEMGTQILMGNIVRVWKQSSNWCYVQTEDRYLTWLENGTFVRCARKEVDAWNNEPLLIVTAMEDTVLEQPEAGATPVSDVVVGDLVKKSGDFGDWLRAELPDGRAGYLPKRAAANYADWKASRKPTAEGIERTARQFLGRPYLWGGTSPKGLDCSGFTKLVFFLNGIELNRDAGEQAREGREIPLDADLSKLTKGDLLFFGRTASSERAERIVHVGIYLGDKMFIQSSEKVQINSLDPESPIRDERRIRTLALARRVLPEP